MNKYLTLFIICFVIMGSDFLFTKESKADNKCSSISGEWTGSKKGKGYEGSVNLTAEKNCSYTLYLGKKHVCWGNFSNNKNDVSFDYAQDCGSRGTVKVDGDNMTWVNTYTGDNYKIKMKRVNKGK